MVADFEEGRILGELQDLDQELEMMDKAIYWIKYIRSEVTKPEMIAKEVAAIERVIVKLKHEKERKEIRLMMHRQKVKESGIKY